MILFDDRSSVSSSEDLVLHLPVGEKPDQGRIGLQAAAHTAPVPKRLIRQISEIEYFPAGKAESAVVIRVVTGFLKLDEGGGDVDQLPLDRFAVQAGCELGGIDVLVNATAVCFMAEWRNARARLSRRGRRILPDSMSLVASSTKR